MIAIIIEWIIASRYRLYPRRPIFTFFLLPLRYHSLSLSLSPSLSLSLSLPPYFRFLPLFFVNLRAPSAFFQITTTYCESFDSIETYRCVICISSCQTIRVNIFKLRQFYSSSFFFLPLYFFILLLFLSFPFFLFLLFYVKSNEPRICLHGKSRDKSQNFYPSNYFLSLIRTEIPRITRDPCFMKQKIKRREKDVYI